MTAFYMLCVAVVLAVLLLGTCAGMLLTATASFLVDNPKRRDSLLRHPTLLFSVRVFPFVLGLTLCLGFALPSFLMLEPRTGAERPGVHVLMLSVISLAGLTLIVLRSVASIVVSHKISREWLRGAARLPLPVAVPVYRIENPEALIASIGILRPRILIGAKALSSLAPGELQAAICHELTHARLLDNLKELLLRVTRPPHWFRLFAFIDAAWRDGAELAADANALQQGIAALDLSSAIVKIGRLRLDSLEVSAVVACHLVSPGHSTALAIRVIRLNALLMGANSLHPRPHRRSLRILLPLLIIAYITCLPTALPMAHQLIELLVR